MKTKMLTKFGALENVEVHSWEDYAPTIGAHNFDVVYLGKNTIAVVDDDGLLKPNFFWIHKGYPQPLAGPALFFGSNDEGDDLELEEEEIKNIRKDIIMLDRWDVQMIAKHYDPLDYRPYFFSEKIDGCFEKCSYESARAGECRCQNNEAERHDVQCPM